MLSLSPTRQPKESPMAHELDPALRVLLIALRHALIIVADALGDYCGLQKRS